MDSDEEECPDLVPTDPKNGVTVDALACGDNASISNEAFSCKKVPVTIITGFLG